MTSTEQSSSALTPLTAGHQKALAWLQDSPKRMLIGGQWVNALSGKTFDVINPATEQKLTTVAEADSADVDAAVVAARRAFEAPTWSGISPHARTRLLLKIADAVEQHTEELAVLETLDMGSPFHPVSHGLHKWRKFFVITQGGRRRSLVLPIQWTHHASSSCCVSQWAYVA